MFKIKGSSTYTKTMLLILISSLAFILLFISMYFYTIRQEKEVRDVSVKQFNNEIKTLLQLNADSHVVTITDITYWDELVDFVVTKDRKWFEQSISPSLSVFKADYFGVFDLNNNLIMDAPTPNVASMEFVPKEVFQKLHDDKKVKFYMKSPNGIVEVLGATIHPSNDPMKNKSKPSGYFFMITLLDAKYFNILENIVSSEIKVVDKGAFHVKSKDDIYAHVNLKDFNNQVVSELIFKRPFTINFKVTKYILITAIIAFIINIIIKLLYFNKWIFKPLKFITNILETENKDAIHVLQTAPGEFGHIGNLFKENISQRKQLEKSKEKAEESDRLKSAFLANLSHEIRTPMNAILGFTDLLNNSNLPEKDKLEYLSIINQSGNNLISIIDDLIEMSKIDSNLIRPNFTSVDLNVCAAELYNSIKITIPKEKNVEFKILRNVENFPGRILTDKVKLKQIVTNLITNAIKFTNDGIVTFEYNIDKNNSKIHFKIQDTGIGIEEKEQENIFDRFRRVDNEHGIKVGGLGLGLAISKAYVEMLGGKLAIKSKVGVGSTFEFSIPLRMDTSNNEENNTKSESFAEIIDENKTILIAEDDNINFLLIDKIMKLKNYKIIRAKDGEEAVEICENNADLDLVLMDIKMPKLNGYEAIEKIKKFRPNLPIIAQTAYSSMDDQEKIKQAGFTSYITKPIVKEELFNIIVEVLKK